MEAAQTSGASSTHQAGNGEVQRSMAGQEKKPAMRGQGRTPRYAMKRNALLVTSHANARCSTAAGTVPHSQQSQPGRPCQAALQASAIPPQPLPLQPRFNNNALPLHPALSNVAAKPFVPYSQGTSRWHPPLQSGGVPVYYSQSDNTHPPLAMPLTSFGDKASAHEPLVTTGGLPPLVPSRPSFQLQPNNHARVAAAPPDVRRGLQAHSAGANPPLAPARSSAQPPFCPAATAQPVPFGSYTQSAPKSVAERVVKFLHYGREKAVAALRCSQKLESDGGCKGDASRGPGNRPRGIWSLPEVQEMQIEILGKAGLDIVDNTGALQINPATHMPFKNLPKKYATEARDLLETLLLDYHSGCVEVEKAIGNAKAELREAGHFLSVEAVRQHTVGLLDRLLEHLDSLRQEPDRSLGDWIVRWSDADTSFVQERLFEFVEADDNDQVKYTHYGEFLSKYRAELPSHTTVAYLRMVVKTLVQHELPPQEWCKHVIKIKQNIDKKAGRDGSQLSRDWMNLTVESLMNLLRMFNFRHPLRRQDVPMRLTLATVNPLALHYGLSGASLDKISDGVGPKAPGYRLKKQGYERVLALYEADPEGFVLTYALVREMGNVQVVLLWDNIAKGIVGFEDFAAYGVTIGQYEQQLYARYFELSEAAAEEKIEGVMREMRARALRGVEPESGENSWLARQNKRVTGSRSRAKGVQLGRAATLAEVKEVFAVQQETCCVTGQPIYLGKGGLESGMCAAMVLVGRSRTFQLMGCWIARGQGSCPRAAYKEFFEYWGVEGHQYMRFLTVGPEGEVVDELERRVMSILGVDEEGNPVGESILEASVVDNAKPVGGAGVGRTNPSETGSSVGDVSEADRGEQRTRAPDMLVSDLNEAETANEEIREPDAENSVGEAGTGFAEPGKVGSIASEGSTAFAEMDKLVGGPSTLVAETVVAGSHVGRPTDEVAERRVLADGAVSEQEALARESSEASSRRAQPEPEPDPEPESESLSPRLPLVGVHHSWAAVRGPLMEKPMKRGDEKYRRAGLSLLRPSPALADFDDSSFKNTYKAPVLVERDNLALEWTGKRTRGRRRRLLDRAPAQETEAGTGYLLKITFKKKKRSWSSTFEDGQPDRASSNNSVAEGDPCEASPCAGTPIGRPNTAERRDSANEGTPSGRPRTLIRHYFSPRKPRRYASEAPPPGLSEVSTGGSTGPAGSTCVGSAAQGSEPGSRTQKRKTAEAASPAYPMSLLKSTFSKSGRTRDEAAETSSVADIASPGGAAPAGKTTASAYTGDTGAESLQSVGFSAAACYAPSSKLPQDKPSLAVEDRPTTVRTGPMEAVTRKRAKFITPLKKATTFAA